MSETATRTDDANIADAPIRNVPFLPLDIERIDGEDGTITLRSRIPLRRGRGHLPAYVRHFAATRGDAVWLAQRRGPDRAWVELRYREAQERIDRLTQGMLDQNDERPVAILSGNSIEHALVMLAAMQARRPVVAVSPSYAVQTRDFTRLREMIDLVGPGLVFVQSTATYAAALEALDLSDVPVVDLEDADAMHAFARDATAAVAQSVERIDPDAPARLMFTSGSTGRPKAVIHTQRTITDTLASSLQTFGAGEEAPMVRLDWTPWNHVFGATSLGLATAAGGTLFIDDGRPIDPLFAETVRNLHDVRPTSYGSVPAGFAALVAALEADAELNARFFGDVQYVTYAAARLPDDVGARLARLAVKATGQRVAITTGYGSTETTTAGAFVYWPTTRTGLIGLPHPGVEMKLVPFDGDRYEVRLRGIGITPGYWRAAEATRQAFDDQGWYRTGDTASFVDPGDHTQGLSFAGRIAEEFKLQSGIFVKVGALRAALVDACAPLVQDMVLCGEGEREVCLLVWLNLAAARRLAGEAEATREAMNRHPAVLDALVAAIGSFNRTRSGSSERIARFALLDEPPSPERGEITDKGSINQARVRACRSDAVAALYAEPRDHAVFAVEARP